MLLKYCKEGPCRNRTRFLSEEAMIHYAKERLVHGTELEIEDIPRELAEVKVLQLKLINLIKET